MSAHGTTPMRTTDWWSSESTRRSSRSSATRTTSARRSRTSASAIPVALDNKLLVWTALKNNYWPAHYFFDAQGRQRYHHFGEGNYARSEMVIRQLLAEAGRAPKPASMAQGDTRGAETPAAIASIRSPETYIGYWRADRFVSPGGQARDAAKTYASAPLAAQRLGA